MNLVGLPCYGFTFNFWFWKIDAKIVFSFNDDIEKKGCTLPKGLFAKDVYI